MKGIIVYRGRYGATRQYAESLGRALQLPVVNTDDTGKEQLTAFDFYIAGSAVYIGKLLIRDWLRQNLPVLSRKKIFFFQVAGAPPSDTEKRMAYDRTSIPPELQVNAEFFFLPGRMIFSKLSWKDRLLLKMGALLTRDPAEKKEMKKDYDSWDPEALAPLIAAVRRFTGISMQKARPEPEFA